MPALRPVALELPTPSGPCSDGVAHDAGDAEHAVAPPSCTRLWINLIGLISGLLAMYSLRQSSMPRHLAAAILLAAVAAPILILEALFLRTYARESTGLNWRAKGKTDPVRVFTKLLGLAATLAVFASGYWIFPEYRGAFYEPFYNALKTFGPWMLALAVPYFFWLDSRMREPRDAYWHLGRWLITPGAAIDWALVRRHFLGWLVKAFFLPLMFVYLNNAIGIMQHQFRIIQTTHQFTNWFDLLHETGFFVDLLFTVAGYTLTFRLTDTHIRSAEPTVGGWLAALLCYQPFHSIISAQYLSYQGKLAWGPWLERSPVLYAAWGTAILVLVGIYSYSTVTFGCRFSNLTHRGILTNGPYRFTKHPAYVSKNLSWWLISIPFIATDLPTALRQCGLLLLLNLVYVWRAITEERHLSRDPVYVRYALWMNGHGLFAWVGRLIPALLYRPPQERAQAAMPRNQGTGKSEREGS